MKPLKELLNELPSEIHFQYDTTTQMPNGAPRTYTASVRGDLKISKMGSLWTVEYSEYDDTGDYIIIDSDEITSNLEIVALDILNKIANLHTKYNNLKWITK